MDTAKLRACQLFLLDMDGTLNLGDEVLPGAHEFVQSLQNSGRQFVYLTNNSSRSAEDYVARMRHLGFPCERENVFTSSQATAQYLLAHYADRPVYLVGTQAFSEEDRKSVV